MKTIFRSCLKEKFTVIPNAMLRDSSLSFRARGLLAMILTNTEDWVVSSDRLQQSSPKEGRDSIRTTLEELRQAGYAVFSKQHTETGTFNSVWTFYDKPKTVSPKTAGPSPEKPSPAKPSSLEELSKKELSEEETKEKKKNSAGAVPVEKQTPSEHAVFVKQWSDEYKRINGVDYVFNGGRDGKAVKKLLSTGNSASALIREATAAWVRFKSPFLRQRASTVHGFADALNEIRCELRDLDKASRPHYAV